jgi:hypothetical protein
MLGGPTAVPAPNGGQLPTRPPGWYLDPLDASLVRYFDGTRWTFWTQQRQQAASEQPTAPSNAPAVVSIPPVRPDIAAARSEARNLLGAEKEIRMLADRLQTEEQVLALARGQGEGFGVLACTNHRLLFFFSGLIRQQFLQVSWKDARHVIYNVDTKRFDVYTVRPTRRAIPALSVLVPDRKDAVRIAQAAEAASAAPRLDIV